MSPVVIDSFLVRDRRVTGLDAHLVRFTASVRHLLGETVAAQVPAAVADLRAETGQGRRFPRLEADADGVTWQDRPAPDQRAVMRVPSRTVRDERTLPEAKGPDLDWLTAAAEAARVRGFDDVVLVGDDGVHETTTAAIVLRSGAGLVSPDRAVMPSTTLAWLGEAGEHVERRHVPVEELWAAAERGEAFALNALHGPRLLVGEARLETAAHVRGIAQVTRWRAAWFEAAEPLA